MGVFKTVVWLDGPIVPDLENHWDGVEIDFVTEKRLGNPDSYKVTPDVLLKIKGLSRGNVDLFVIGNNLGAGLEKAKAVSPEMRDRVVIIYNAITLEEKEAYKTLGFTRFESRGNFSYKAVGGLLGIQ